MKISRNHWMYQVSKRWGNTRYYNEPRNICELVGGAVGAQVLR